MKCELWSGADPGFFLGGGALVSRSSSTPINHIVFFFLQNTSCIRKPQVISGGGGVRTPFTLPLDPLVVLQNAKLVIQNVLIISQNGEIQGSRIMYTSESRN